MQITEVCVVFFEHVETHLSVRIWNMSSVWYLDDHGRTVDSICKNSSQMFSLLYAFITVPLTWPESHRSESEIDRLLVTRALVGECFDYNGGMRDHKAPISSPFCLWPTHVY